MARLRREESELSAFAVALTSPGPFSGSVGSILMRNLLANPFGGVVYPINPKRRAVQQRATIQV